MAGLMSTGTGGTHTHAASGEDMHIVLTLIKEEETCGFEKIVSVCVCVCDGDLRRKLTLNSLSHFLKVFLSRLMFFVLLSVCPFCVCVCLHRRIPISLSLGVCMCIHKGGCVRKSTTKVKQESIHFLL